MKFELTEDEVKVLREFEENHKCPCKHRQGPIGGLVTISFTPTTIGTVVEAECLCGEKITIRDL